MYKVVLFTDDDELAVVPSNWLDGKGCCLWPPFKSSTKLTKAVINQEKSSETWTSYQIRLLPGGESDNYERAREKLRLAEDTSDLQTAESEEEEESLRHSKRKKRNTARLITDEADYSNDDTFCDNTPPRTMQQLQPISASQFTVTNRWLPVPPSVPSSSSEQVPHNSSTVQLTNNSPISGMNLRILRTMEHVRADVAHLSIKMDRVLARLDQMASNGKEVQELPEDVSLPLADLTALGELERLLQNEATARALVSRLGLIGGESVKDTTTRIMTSVVSHPLALQLNWMGKGEKTGFSTLCLKEVVFKAVRRNPEIHKATDNDIEKCAKDWLRGASDRNGARKLRYMRAAASSSTTEMPEE